MTASCEACNTAVVATGRVSRSATQPVLCYGCERDATEYAAALADMLYACDCDRCDTADNRRAS
jgi:hypothetical protein